jgi:ERCC4-type nuclease
MVKIILDCREHDVFEALSTTTPTPKVEIIVQSLDIGDIIITDDEDKELIIIERKNIKDLEVSIKDGRYEEQSYRLSGYDSIPNHNIFYLIEGNLEKYCQKKADKLKKTLYSSLFSIIYYKGFSLIQSNSVNETAFLILNIADKLTREIKKGEKEAFYSGGGEAAITPSEDKDNYSSVIKKVKKENINKENIGEIMLSQIPGVSPTFANAVLSKYGNSLPVLIKELENDPECLNGIKYKNKKDKMQKISKTCCKNIREFLIHEPDPNT